MPTPLQRSLSSLRLARKPKSGIASQFEDTEVDELNQYLLTLVEIYPEHDVHLLRQSLSAASKDSRLQYVANLMAALPSAVIYRQHIDKWERFRTPQYQDAVRTMLRNEYKKLSKSTIDGVLAENNYDYTRSKQALSMISAKSWRISLVRWISGIAGSSADKTEDFSSISTGCTELDEELDALHNSTKRKEQIALDAQVARDLNLKEHERAQEVMECQCCFGDVTWDEICHCSNLHYFCHGCLRRTVEESVYGQGHVLDQARGTARCISSSTDPPCTATVPRSILAHALPPELLQAVEDRLARDAQDSSALALCRCPFCPYAIVDEDRLESTFEAHFTRFVEMLAIGTVAYAAIFPHPAVSLLALMAAASFGLHALGYLRPAIVVLEAKLNLPTMGLRPRGEKIAVLRCRNPRCGRSSCLECGKEWIGMHDCSRQEQDRKRAYMEQVLAEAIKRTCPKCHTSFVKSGGCNKMTCPCGYKMCYLCRADVGEEQYDHFCPHFRARPGEPCRECQKCLLFQEENEDEVLQSARAKAEEEWIRMKDEA